jgi:AcrR family transcriptional regulator
MTAHAQPADTIFPEESRTGLPTQMDGRRLRSARNREAFLVAGLTLIVRDGNWAAMVPQLCAECGLCRRTFFARFRDLEAFRKELIRRHGAELVRTLSESVNASPAGSRYATLIRKLMRVDA